MTEQHPSLLRVDPRLRLGARWALYAVLAGYMAFNKPFAQFGYPPLYLGEILLACCVLASLEWLRPAVLEPVRASWTFRFIALFLLYGLLRGGFDFLGYGWLALRDSVVAGYAILAFVAPVVLCRAAPSVQNDEVHDMTAKLLRVLLPTSLVAGLWAASIHFNWFRLAGSETKVDFMTLAAAIGAWVWAIYALRNFSLRQAASAAPRGLAGALAFSGGLVLALTLAALVRALPTRTVWLSVAPLAFVFCAAWMHAPRRRAVFFTASAIAAAAALIFFVARVGPVFAKFGDENALNKNLYFSLDEVEARLTKKPEKHERLVLDTPIATDDKTRTERMQSLLMSGNNFSTLEGNLGAHAVKWRAMFWMRCWNYTLNQAPLLGVGFGRNLTNLLRNTPAWPMYVDSIRVDPPNRSPHSAHIGIFTRLGLVGFGLWLAILGRLFWSGLRVCWLHRRNFTQTGDELHRCRFWDALSILGVWVLFVWAMSFGVILEGPFGGMWFWTLSGVLAWNGLAAQNNGSNSRSEARNLKQIQNSETANEQTKAH